MDLSDRAGLQATVASYLNRSDVDEEILVFIQLAEAELRRALRRPFRGSVRKVAETDERYLTLPSDWLESAYIEVRGARGPIPLRQRSLENLSEMRYENPTPGEPRYYAMVDSGIHGKAMELYPDPATKVVVEMVYYADIALTEANPTNWILERAPDAYLYGTLLASAPFQRDDERVAVWQPLFDRAVAQLNEQSDRQAFSGAPIESSPSPSRRMP